MYLFNCWPTISMLIIHPSLSSSNVEKNKKQREYIFSVIWCVSLARKTQEGNILCKEAENYSAAKILLYISGRNFFSNSRAFLWTREIEFAFLYSVSFLPQIGHFLVAFSSVEELQSCSNLPDFFHFTWHTESLSFLLWLLSKIYNLPQAVFARGNTWDLSPQFFEDYHRKHRSLQCKALKVNFELFHSLRAWWGLSCTVQEQPRSGSKTYL